RRRPFADALPRAAPAAEERDDPGVLPVRDRAAPSVRRPRLRRRLRPLGDAIYPMTYPSHYTAGEYNLPDPNAVPGTTVAHSLRDFRRRLTGGKALLVPWLQDFSLYRTYTSADVAAQVAAARDATTGGFMLWNAAGVYTPEALHGGAPP